MTFQQLYKLFFVYIHIDEIQSTKIEKTRQTLKDCGISDEEIDTCRNSEFVQEVVELSLRLCLKTKNTLQLCNVEGIVAMRRF